MKKFIYLILIFPIILFSQESVIGDVDCNGEITSEDAALILQFVTNVIDELPCQDNMTGLTPEQLQEMISLMNEQLSVSYNGSGGNNYPTMVSSISSESMNWGDALIYCDGLEEGGYSDWFLPNIDQLAYAVSGGCELPDERTAETLWSSSNDGASQYDMVLLSESGTTGIFATSATDTRYCRCTRFGEGETSGGSSSSYNSDASITENSAQPITMIGPMYRQGDFEEFNHYYKYQYPSSTSDNIYYIDAIRFCAQLSYNGYDDWVLPSFKQLQNYLKQESNPESSSSLIIPNFDGNTTQYFWVLLDGTQTSGAGGYIYTPALEITGGAHPYPNMPTVLYSWSLDSSIPRCFCVR